MISLAVVRVMALVSTGLMAGLLFGDWLGPSFARSAVSTSSFIEFQQIIHLNYLIVLPALATSAAGLPVLWMIMVRQQRSHAEFRLVALAAAAIILGFVITLVFNVPINDQLERWSVTAPPADAWTIWKRWEQAHVVRTVLWMSGFILEAVALAVSERTLSAHERTSMRSPAGYPQSWAQ